MIESSDGAAIYVTGNNAAGSTMLIGKLLVDGTLVYMKGLDLGAGISGQSVV